MFIVYDTDFLYSLFFSDQSTHLKSKQIFNTIVNDDILVLKLVKFEFLTVISNKESHLKAVEAYQKLESLKINYFDLTLDLENVAMGIFIKQDKNKVSFIDCANLAVAKRFSCKIASFDQFYPKEFCLY